MRTSSFVVVNKKMKILLPSTNPISSWKPLGDDSHVQFNMVYLCVSRKCTWDDDTHAHSLGSSGACAKKLRLSG